MSAERNQVEHPEKNLRTWGESRTRWIYEQYHSGKVVIMDDFEYLGRKDPEGCEKLMKSLLNKKHPVHKDENRMKKEKEAIDYINQLEREVTEAESRLKIDSSAEVQQSKQRLENVKESLVHAKEMVQLMEQKDLADMMNHLYQIADLKEQYKDELRGWMMLLEETDRFYVPENLTSSEFII